MGNKSIKKVCVVTAARSEYGVLRWIIDLLNNDKDIQLQLVVTGAHLSEESGFTYKFIEEDGYRIDKKIDIELQTKDLYSIPRSMGICAIKFGEAFKELRPDLLVLLGDRYELLPIANTALILNIPIAHISGGDITEGAIDNEVRNALSMMSSIHFPGTQESADRLYRMLNTTKNIYTVGEPGLDSFNRYKLLSREELASQLNLDVKEKWMLVTLHSETKEPLEYNIEMVQNLYKAMKTQNNTHFIITKANSDFGGIQINSFWDSINEDENVTIIASLGQIRYLSIMKQVECVIGNSSSGIIEAPFLGIPVINIGNRQKGRHICDNIICCKNNSQDIMNAFLHIYDFRIIDKFWGDGYSSQRIVTHIKEFLLMS